MNTTTGSGSVTVAAPVAGRPSPSSQLQSSRHPSRIGKEVSKTAVIRIGMLMLSHFRHARIQAIRRISSIIELIPMEQSGRGA